MFKFIIESIQKKKLIMNVIKKIFDDWKMWGRKKEVLTSGADDKEDVTFA